MTIALQFLHGGDAASRLIEWFSHGAGYSHVDAVLPDGRLLGARSDNVGNAPPGVQIRDPGYVAGTPVLTLHLPADTPQETVFYDFLNAQIGKPYDALGILAFVGGRDWRAPDSWFCSELCAAALEACGYFPWPLASTTNKITPADLLLAISARDNVDPP
ncbi:MAG: hypothetical protein ACYDAK_12835 [Candidatus Limnocylindrales bacterium]